MTRLRKMMLEELERRNYSEATTRCYIRTVEDFSKRFKRSPDCLGPEHIREYQAELFKKRRLSPGHVGTERSSGSGHRLQCYTGQYGRGASVNMNFTTKSGSNSFHGNAKWDWNGRYLNPNDWFNNANGTARPFANNNEWGGSIGGPILKNKLFFFYDNEGLRYVLPAGGVPVYIPTAAWAADVRANINATRASREFVLPNDV
jgi:hypothetical protein